MSDHHSATSHGDDHHGLGHQVPTGLLFGVLIALLFLTGITVWTAKEIDLGKLNILIAMLIASAKASLVALFFMHLRWDKPFNGIVLVASVLFVSLFIAFAMMDTHAYQPDIIDRQAPAMVDRQ